MRNKNVNTNAPNADLRPLPHRILPPLSPENRLALRLSIEKDGVQNPAIVDQMGQILDGQERVDICNELGRYCPRKVVNCESDWKRYEIAISANCSRRQLGQKEKRQVIENYLRADPEINDQWLADIIGGTSRTTVMGVRKQLEDAGAIPHFAKRRCRDQKYRPATYVAAHSPKEFRTATEAVSLLPAPKMPMTMDATTARRRMRHRIGKERASEEVDQLTYLPSSVAIHHCRFQDLESRGHVTPHSVHLMLTDIPYGQEFLPEVKELVELASNALVQGGILAVMCGGYYLPEVFRHLNTKVEYRWLIPTIWTGDATRIQQYNLLTKWKPVVVASKGSWRAYAQFCDVVYAPDKEKDDHPWHRAPPDL